jgi:ribonuclease Z
MPEVIMLGTGRALPTAAQENTYFVIAGRERCVMVDCAGAPYRRLLKAQLDPARLSAVVITHFHPDHAYGVPSLLLSLWLAGRMAPLALCAPDDALIRIQEMVPLYGSDSWPGMFPVHYRSIAMAQGAPVLEDEEFTITAAPGRHFVPTVSIRAEDRATGKAMVYSSDTEPHPGIAALARGADLLIHEATGAGHGHSSAAQAAEAARDAGVPRLVLVHYDRTVSRPAAMRREARRVFAGEVIVARDFDRIGW